MISNVVLLSYNRPRMFREAMESVFSQTYKEFRIWVYDDGSDFDMKEILDEYDDERIVLVQADKVSIEERIRLGSTRWPENLNYIVQQIPAGEAITYLCDDDLLHPEWLEQVDRALASSEIVHVILGDMYYFYDGQNALTDSKRGFPAAMEKDHDKSVMWWNLGAFSYRSDCTYTCDAAWGDGLNGWAHSWDVELIESLKRGHTSYIFLPMPSVYRREHENTLSARMGRLNEDGLYYKPAGEMLPEHVKGFLE